MSRRIAVISCASLGLLLGGATLVFFWQDKGKLTVSFVNAETSYAAPQPLWNVECLRLAFAVRNDGIVSVPFVVFDIEDEHGNWVKSFHTLEDAEAGRTTQLYLYVPKGSHPQAVRLRGYRKANALEKSKTALRSLIGKVSGTYTNKQVWFPKLSVPAYEFIVKVDSQTEPVRRANAR